MGLWKSLDENKIIAAVLHDVFTSCGKVGIIFNSTARRATLKRVSLRTASEGLGFLTKTLPRLGKAFDKALTGDTKLTATSLGFTAMKDSKLPSFLGELFSRVLSQDGTVLQDPCELSVSHIRQICYLFYKYELPYTEEQEQQVISRFEKTESDLSTVNRTLDYYRRTLDATIVSGTRRHKSRTQITIAREAKILLSRLFSSFDPKNISPRHGPGAVATKQRLWDKYLWTNISARITRKYALDEYFYTSLTHFCDSLHTISRIKDADLPARVILVPKDSRGPRLISCEPVDFQWIQQGLGRAIVGLVEKHSLTKSNVFFTDQAPNRRGALLGSSTGKYATLDLNEASDRVSLELVRLLFPPHICEYLEACRSSSTVLPDSREIELRKFAPMGSCLCFPIMALTIWSILTAGAPDADTRDGILVYGDDVIVPTAYAVDAMKLLESFGLKINRDKSCISGLFRESCGMDAFKGYDVTPVRLRTVWSSSRSPESYSSWIAYANSFFRRGFFLTYDCIVRALHHLYGAIPTKDMHLACPSLDEETEHQRPIRSRQNVHLQKKEYKVWDVKSVAITHTSNGWSMLLRYFAEKANDQNREMLVTQDCTESFDPLQPFSVSTYTRRGTSMLVSRWR